MPQGDGKSANFWQTVAVCFTKYSQKISGSDETGKAIQACSRISFSVALNRKLCVESL